MDTEEYSWVGIALPHDVRANKVMVTPLAFYEDEAKSWQPLDASARKHYFPNEGKVIVFEREWSGCEPNCLYQFWPELNRQSKVSPEIPSYAKYWVPQLRIPASLAEVLDWTAVTTSAGLPVVLAQQRSLKHAHTQHVYIRHTGYLYGPIVIDPQSGLPREYAQSAATGGPSLLVRVHGASSNALLHLTVNDSRLVLLDENHLDTPQREEDWSLPQVVIKRVLEASNKLPLTAEEDVRLVDRRIKELARASSQEGTEALHLPLATLERAQRIVGNQLAVLQALDAVGATLTGLPALRPHVDAAIAQEVRARAGEVEREVTARLADEQQRLTQTQADISTAQARLATLSMEITQAQEHKERLQRDMAAFETQMAQRIEALRAQPMQTLADLHLASVLLPALPAQDAQPSSSIVKKHAAEVLSAIGGTQTLADAVPEPGTNVGEVEWRIHKPMEVLAAPDALKRRWVTTAQRFGVRSQDVRACASILLAGYIPVPVGDGAIAALLALGAVLAGGRTWSVPVPITALSPVDLFGSIDPATRHFIPAAGGLADIVLAAQKHPDDLGLVIFEGWDRIPGMPTYVPLVRQYLDVRRQVLGDRVPAPLSLFHPRALATDDPYATLDWLSWPPNLLIAGVLDETDGSFPIPPECASSLVRPEIVCNASQLMSREGDTGVVSVGASAWADWSRSIRSANTANRSADPAEQQAASELLTASLHFWGSPSEAEITALINASAWGARAHGHQRIEGQFQ